MSASQIGWNIVGSLILYCSCTLASAAGIGGGGLSVLLVIFSYGFGRGVVLSLWAIFGNILTQCLLTASAHHPMDKSRPLVYWDIVFVLLPAKLFGSTIGVLISSSAPSDVLAILAIFVLLFVTAVTFKKYLDAIDLEHAAVAAVNDDVKDIASSVNINRAILSVNLTGEKGEVYSPGSPNKKPIRIEIPWRVVGALLLTWAAAAVSFSLLAAVRKCSTSYIIIASCCYPALIVTMFVRLSVLIKKQELSSCATDVSSAASPSNPLSASAAPATFPPTTSTPPAITLPTIVLEGDVVWKKWGTRMPFGAVLVGALSALLGIDSGELIMPMFLGMGLLPQVAGATTSMLSLFVTTATLFEYGVRHELQISYAFWFFGIGVAGGLTGRQIITRVRRSSFTILALVGILVLDIILLVVYLSTHSDPDYDFHSFCN